MLHSEFYRVREDGRNLIRIYSDESKPILQTDTGEVYEEVIDFEDTTHEYIEVERGETE